MRTLALALILLLGCSLARADQTHVAVAANFLPTFKALQQLYESNTGRQLIVSSASTGKLYAQIRHGAPFDIFLSADTARPQRLIEADRVLDDRYRLYAIGQLSLWSALPDYAGADCRQLLESGQIERLAIANPKTAPYGAAAVEVLEKLAPRTELVEQVARGESIGQAFQFVRTGNAEMGFVAKTQVVNYQQAAGCRWDVPASYHSPLEQAVVILKASDNIQGAQRLMHFLTRSERARDIIYRAGYRLPEPYSRE